MERQHRKVCLSGQITGLVRLHHFLVINHVDKPPTLIKDVYLITRNQFPQEIKDGVPTVDLPKIPNRVGKKERVSDLARIDRAR